MELGNTKMGGNSTVRHTNNEVETYEENL